jgi:ornithine cyclodeaminase
MPPMSGQRAILAIDAATVRRLLPMERCIELMRDALVALARGEVANPLRSVVLLPFAPAALASMPAAIGTDSPALGVKVISVFPGNRARGLESHQGFVLLCDPEDGRPTAIVDAGAITELRTAAVSGLATDLLARPDAGDLAILGSGTQARSHLLAMRAVRPIRRVRAWSPTPQRLAAFAADAGERSGVRVEPMASAREAVEGADIVCTVTASRDPLFEADWLAAGSHVNAVGASTPANRELDGATLRRARLFVDRRESALVESGEIVMAIRDGIIDASHIVAEIGEVAAGLAQGRGSPGEVTIFKSLGLAVEDVVAAGWVHRQAQATGAGTPLAIGQA